MANTNTSPLIPSQSKASLITEVTNRIILTDPNEIIAQQTGMQNAIPDYETMSPFVEMYAIRKEGVEIVLGEDGTYNIIGQDLSTRINFLNFDIPSQSYTTNYTGDIVGTPDRDANEGFGIKSINVKMNANYMPMVDVSFIDIKGSSVIRPGEKSPLAVLFDFPSPIFKIRLKGAFGKFVEYDLHMTKNDIEYTDSGDFIIKASFIGEFFGPLTDVLLGYIKSVPYLKGKDTVADKDDSTPYQLSSGEITTANSFAKLVNRGDLLYTKIADYQSNTTKNKARTEKIATLNNLPDFERKLAELDTLDLIKITEAASKENPPVSGVSEILIGKLNGIEHSVYLSIDVVYDPIIPITLTNPLAAFISSYIKNNYVNPLMLKFEELKKNTNNTSLRFEDMVTFGEMSRFGNDKKYTYFINYSALVDELALINNTIKEEINGINTSMEKDVSLIVKNSIDFRPSIRNVFEILLNDFDSFLTILKSSGEAKKELGALQYGVQLRKTLIDAPYPEIIQKKTLANQIGIGGGIQADVLVYPGDIAEFRGWDEVKLVELYCKSLISQLKDEQQIRNIKAQSSTGNYIPLFPLEVYGNPANDANPYQLVSNPSDLFKKILLNYVTLRDFAYGVAVDITPNPDYKTTLTQTLSVLSGNLFIINQETRKSLVELLAKSEARNIANALSGTNTMAKMLIDIAGNQDKIGAMRANIDKNSFGTEKNILGNNESIYFSSTKKPLPKTSTEQKDMYKDIFYRSHVDFNGIQEIINPDNTEHKKIITLFSNTTTPNPTDFDNERNEVLKSIASTIFGSNEVYKAVISEANTFIFPDSETKSNGLDVNVLGKTDFYNDTAYHILTNDIKIDDNGAYIMQPTLKDFFDNNTLIANSSKLTENGNTAILKKFLYPGAVEIPYWSVLYIGYTLVNNSNNSFATTLSNKDKDIFEKIYNEYNNIGYKKDITDTITAPSNYNPDNDDERKAYFTSREWFKKFLTKRYIINNSGTTFLDPERLELDVDKISNKGFRSAELTSNDQTLTYYLNTLFNEVQKKLNEYTKSNEAEIVQAQSNIDDSDFKLNIYMSFKTIYDRWLAGNNDYIGQSGQKATNPLRERFKYITRSQQDIGDLAIVDFKNLITDSKDKDVNVFTAISNLLSQNQYMFFPLHSFMEYNKGNTVENWENNFKILPKYSEQTLSKPSFICMYIGSYSSRLNVGKSNGNYDSDGFSLTGNGDLPSDFLDEKGENIFAFNVKVGSQSQMVFSKFTANTTEFKNTDVSLKIQDDIINKQTNSNRIGKAQNLLNIYNQRSYTMGVTIPFGNMCIQPTQYFEISGIPIWNGIYMIHEVSHEISAGMNRMTTNFKGYKLGKYVFPVVTEYIFKYLGISNDFGNNSYGATINTDVKLLDNKTLDILKNLDERYVISFTNFLASLAADGWKVTITDGRRTRERQLQLHKENSNNPAPGGIYDSHVNGMAIDCNFTRGNLTLAQKVEKQQWIDSGIPARAYTFGLRWGGDFKATDVIHFDNGYPDGKTIGQGVNVSTKQLTNTAKYSAGKDINGLFLSSLLPFGSADNTRFAQEVINLSANIAINPNALMAAMYLESHFKTTARASTSSGAGLIQFVEQTAKLYTHFYNEIIRPQNQLPIDILTPNIIAQLNPFEQLKLIEEFLKSNLKRTKNQKNKFFDVSLAIFSPNNQRDSNDKKMFEKNTSSYVSNRQLDMTSKGFITVGDYKTYILARVENELGILPEKFIEITS